MSELWKQVLSNQELNLPKSTSMWDRLDREQRFDVFCEHVQELREAERVAAGLAPMDEEEGEVSAEATAAAKPGSAAASSGSLQPVAQAAPQPVPQPQAAAPQPDSSGASEQKSSETGKRKSPASPTNANDILEAASGKRKAPGHLEEGNAEGATPNEQSGEGPAKKRKVDTAPTEAQTSQQAAEPPAPAAPAAAAAVADTNGAEQGAGAGPAEAEDEEPPTKKAKTMDAATLSGLTRKQLQALAKEHKIPANISTAKIISRLTQL